MRLPSKRVLRPRTRNTNDMARCLMVRHCRRAAARQHNLAAGERQALRWSRVHLLVVIASYRRSIGDRLRARMTHERQVIRDLLWLQACSHGQLWMSLVDCEDACAGRPWRIGTQCLTAATDCRNLSLNASRPLNGLLTVAGKAIYLPNQNQASMMGRKHLYLSRHARHYVECYNV